MARRLAEEYPDAVCELDHGNPFQLLAATILSAQTTDVRVNMVTPTLFARYPTPEALAGADPAELEEIVRSTGFYANKSRSLVGMAQALVERFDGEVPTRLEDLVTLPGVGRKTGKRRAQRGASTSPACRWTPTSGGSAVAWGSPTEQDPVKVELELNSFLPAAERGGSACG